MQKGELRLWVTVVMASVLISEVSVRDYDTHYKFNNKYVFQENFPADVDSAVAKEYVRYIHSMFDAYREVGDNDGDRRRLVIDTNALIDTKFKAWKRNADLINSLLALPKGMINAGR